MRGGGVAQSYLDPLAVRVQSIRTGPTGRGWRRFLVFAELTKSKKGSEYVALFTYFSFEGTKPRTACHSFMAADSWQHGYVLSLPRVHGMSSML